MAFGSSSEVRRTSWDGYKDELKICAPHDTHDDSDDGFELMLGRRIKAIFRQVEVADKWTRPAHQIQVSPSDGRFPPPEPFDLHVDGFLKLAYANAPAYPEATVSAFAGWLYSLYSSAYGDDADRQRGIALEGKVLWKESPEKRQERIEQSKRHTVDFSQFDLYDRRWLGWKLVHCGLRVKDEESTWFSIDALRVGREPLRGSPDLLFQNEITGEVIIVEIKDSHMRIPTNLWPNIWGQLWCYSAIPVVKAATSVTVVGEIWGTAWEKREYEYRYTTRYHFEPRYYMRASVRRDPRHTAYDRFFRALFNIYRSNAKTGRR
ncbi:conserved hypothetical protein [Cupriavidus taiwanensis]|uniref:hypothetical protein n=1 Tax=Cupriavidus taiwanensis TaxID=164546 RepID=UPI000E136BB3|nr:hypothetical protein [Cupriavidus taiwanensis]SPA03029.1 conserved hypothetical protein [Cupriavidus taiwanensis]